MAVGVEELERAEQLARGLDALGDDAEHVGELARAEAPPSPTSSRSRSATCARVGSRSIERRRSTVSITVRRPSSYRFGAALKKRWQSTRRLSNRGEPKKMHEAIATTQRYASSGVPACSSSSSLLKDRANCDASSRFEKSEHSYTSNCTEPTPLPRLILSLSFCASVFCSASGSSSNHAIRYGESLMKWRAHPRPRSP